jgi:S1-C subfamily serine protease
MLKKFLITSSALATVLALSACSTFSAISGTAAAAPVAQSQAATASPVAEATAEPTDTTSSTPVLSGDASTALAAIQGTLSGIYEKVNPSVVNIEVTSTVSQSQNWPFESPFSTPQGQSPSQVEQALGSGFVWDKIGHIVTNNHVVNGADTITVRFSDGSTADATLVGADPDSDLAVIKVDVDASKLYPVTVANSDNVKVGQMAIAIGNPYGLEGTMTVGIVSALGRSLDSTTTADSSSTGTYTIPDVIQTDAPINPGNSGGVLLNDAGEVIGVTSAIESSTNSNAGIGFAIPANIVTRIIPSLISDGKAQHAWLGISGTTMTSAIAKAMNLPEDTTGALVFAVTSGGPADTAGLKGSSDEATIQGAQIGIGGDVITAIDSQPVKSFDDLVSYLTTDVEVGQTVTLQVLRNGKSINVDVTLGSRPTDQATQEASSVQTANRGGYLGITGATMAPQIAEAMNLDQNTAGVLIASVDNGSPADKAGLKGGDKTVSINGNEVPVGGDIITAVDGQSVESIQSLREMLSNYYPGDIVTLTILRDGGEMQVSVTLGELP